MKHSMALVALSGLLLAAPAVAEEGSLPMCSLEAPRESIAVPAIGFQWLDGGDFEGSCDGISVEGAVRGSSGDRVVFVQADGPAGSGRFWSVSVGVGDGSASTPERGVCTSTSTVGWRTLRQYSRGALPWLEDLDGDGDDEFVLWVSFPLQEFASMSGYGLAAWVYRWDLEGSLVLDWELSRGMARTIAQEYRAALPSTIEDPGERRETAAEALELFASEACRFE
jgi:hypothetical protein